MLVAHGYLSSRTILTQRKASLLELMICVVFAVIYFLSIVIKPKMGYYSILFAVALYFFAYGNGYFSKLLGNRRLRIAAKYSFAFYMIHELVLRTLRLLIPADTMGHYARVF